MDEKTVKCAAAGAIGGAVVCAIGVPASVFAAGLGAIGYTAYRLLTDEDSRQRAKETDAASS